MLLVIRKYLMVATAVSVVANAALWFAWRGAVGEQATVVAQAQAEALQAANQRGAEAAAALRAGFEAREQQLVARIEELNAVSRAANERAARAEGTLNNYATEQLGDDTTEFTEWADNPVPGSVVTRLRGLDK